jgi:uncharacterized protein YifE (UPF0438 family)
MTGVRRKDIDVKPLPPNYIALINQYLPIYEALHYGRRKPKTTFQVHFVDVANGRTRKCLTDHERAYLSYLEYMRASQDTKRDKRRPKTVSRRQKPKKISRSAEVDEMRKKLGGSNPKSAAAKKEPKPWVRFEKEPFGTRDDWKKDSGRNWSDSRRNRIVD